MVRMISRLLALALGLLCLFGLPRPAASNCAIVLWEYIESSGFKGYWKFQSAYEDLTTCRIVQKRLWELQVKESHICEKGFFDCSKKHVWPVGDSFVQLTWDDTPRTYISYEFKCIPDTLDPRTPRDK